MSEITALKTTGTRRLTSHLKASMDIHKSLPTEQAHSSFKHFSEVEKSLENMRLAVDLNQQIRDSLLDSLNKLSS
jgi:hypothetical protein